MIIQTERLVLRPFEDKDKIWYYNLTQDTEFINRLPGLLTRDYEHAAMDVDIFKRADYINDFYLVIEDKLSNPIGCIVAVSMSSLVIDVSYFLEKRYRGSGYMTEAVKAFVNQVKAKYSSRVFEFQVAKDNTKSLGVIKRLGASIEAFNKEYDTYICYI